jgi:hypothetical protein
MQSSSVSTSEDLIELPIQQNLIAELNDLFGGGLFGTLDESENVLERCWIKKSTALQLFKDVVENIQSRVEEEKLRKIRDDHDFAMKLHEQEKAFKYPQLAQGTSNSFKDIMDTQQALHDYENDTKGWQLVEKKPETMACKLNKEKLYAAFPQVQKSDIDNTFEGMNRNFKETLAVIKDSLELSAEERKNVDGIVRASAKIRDKSGEENGEEQPEMSESHYNEVSRAENLQEEFEHHFSEYYRLKAQAREHVLRKEYDTASYYNSIASLQKQLGEEKRHDFVNLLAELQCARNSTMLDLHYFKLHEAHVQLHTFLDSWISKLRELKKAHIDLDVITGRGAHSSNGIANIKIMATRLFSDRHLK